MKNHDEKFQAIFHNNMVGMILTDEQHIITDINDHLLQLAELERKDVIGKTGLELGILNERFIEKIWQEFTQQAKRLNRELSFKTKSGKTVSCLFSTEKIELEGRAHWLTTIIDISKRKKSERELADIYERVTDGFVAIDSNWHYRYVNKRAGELLEKDPAYLVGKHIWTEFPEDIGQPVYLAYQRAMEKQEMISMEEYYQPYDRWFQNLIYPSPDGLSVFFSDITARKKAEHVIAESELRFRTLTKTAPVGIFETDAKGLTTYVNETWLSYTGLGFEGAMGEGWLNAVHPEDVNSLIKDWYSKSEKAKASFSEYRLVDKAGKLRWVNGKAVPVINKQGTVTGYIGTITDVTDLKLAMELSEQSEDTLNKAQRISKTGSWEFNLQTAELKWSKEQYRIFELEGHPADGLYEAYRNKYHPDDLELLDKIIAEALKNGKGFSFEHRIVCNDGSIKYILAIGEVISDAKGNVTGLKGTGQDITESKKYELELLKSHQKIDTLINTVDGIVWEADARSFQFTYISKKAEEVLGYPAEQWIEEQQFWADHIHPEDRDWAVNYCVTCTNEKRQHDFEYRMIAKDGAVVWLRDIVSVIVENDKPVQLRGIMIDITQNKKAADALNERTEQLRELSTHLQNVREDERTKIAREIHDELGQQLTGLKMDIAWLKKKLEQGDPVIRAKFDDAIMLVNATVDSIRRISTELRPSIIDDLGLNAAFEWHIREFTERVGIEIQYSNNFDDANINPNIAIGLFRILQESLTNITRHARAETVKINMEKWKDALQLSIEDDGVGFDTGKKRRDLTFGLLGIKERTHMLNGKCVIFSKPGSGTRIEVNLPLN